MKNLAIALVIMIVASSVYAGNNDTPEVLAEQFIVAVNAKSKEKQNATVHPQCFADLSPVQKDYLEPDFALKNAH